MQKLAQLCIRRPVFATMLVLALVVLGLDAYRKLGVDLFPKVEFPIVTISTALRGAAPEEVESQVSKRIEEAVNTISGIDMLSSTSAEGFSVVTVQFLLEKDAEVAAQEVRDKISAILNQLPRDVDPPLVEKLATDAAPVLNVVVSSPRDLRETTKFVDDRIKKNIEPIAGVGQVRFVGERIRQIQVVLDGEKLYSYNLNVDQVRAAVAAQNVEIPGGRLDQGSRELSVRTLGRLERPKDFERVVVGNVAGAPVRISDIGKVVDGVEEPRSLARLDGRAAVVLEVRKQSGTNALEVIHAVKDRVEELKRTLPQDFQISYLGDQSKFIQASFDAVQEHLLLGGILAGLIVLAFIRTWRGTIIASIAIPTSIISTYTLMQIMGFTLNQITMLALTLMVGIVIDDAIVVLENVFRFMEEKKLTPYQAAIEGTKDIGLAVMATTFSLAIVFIPVAMMGGIVGRFMSSFGYTAAFSIIVSLVVSFTLTPMLSSRFLKNSGNGGGTKDTWLFRVVAVPYGAMLRWSMRHRWVIATASVLVISSTLPLFVMIGKDFLPQDDQSTFEIVVRAPAGSSLEGTSAVMEGLEGELRQLPGVQNLLTSIGSDIRRQVDRGSILVELTPIEKRKDTQQQIMVMARERLRKFHDLVIGVQLPSVIRGGGSTAGMQLVLQGPDLDRLNDYATRLKQRLSEVPGVTDIDSSYEGGKPELRVRVNRDKAGDLSVSVASVASALSTLVGGDQQVTTYREGDDRYDVQLRVAKEFRQTPGALNRLYVPSATLGNVPVASVTSLEEASGPTQIDRYNRQRQILVSANLVGGQSLGNVLAIASQAVQDMDLPPGYVLAPVGQSRELGRSGMGYLIAFGLSIVFMYMILASQFESFIDPVTILISLPLSVPFALISLMLLRETFSVIYTSVGILVLFGIVKKNSILQVDHIKSLQREGMPRLESILHGCEDRLRPILMTTAALVAGMLPMALGTGAGSGTRRTVAIVVIGGQTLCLLLSLLVTPVAYSLFDDLAHLPLWSRLRRRSLRSAVPVAPLLLLFAIPAASQPVAPPRVGVSLAERKLTLHETVELALRNNLDIEIERTNTATAAESVNAARGFFDPRFRWQPLIDNRTTPAASVLQGEGGKLEEVFATQNLYFNLPFKNYGSMLDFSFENGRQTTTNAFTTLTPFYTSRLVVSFTQPLLRGRKTDRGRADIRIRSKQRDIAGTELESRVIAVVAQVEQHYWNLGAARQDADVKADGVRWAEEQLSRNQRMIASGMLAPVEEAASQAELERRRDTWFASLGLVTEIENLIKVLIAPGRQSELWGDVLVPVDTRTEEDPLEGGLREAVAEAIKNRVELRRLALRREANDIDKEQRGDEVKPQVNLYGAYTATGLAGAVRDTENPFSTSNALLFSRVNQLSTSSGLPPLSGFSFGSLPGRLVGGYGASITNLPYYSSFQGGLQMEFTIRNHAAHAGLAQAVIAERRLKAEVARAEQIIEAEMRNALQAIQTAGQRIAAAEASARAAREKLDSETRLFQSGESTNFLVLTRQNEYLDSRHRVVVAQLDLNKAAAQLQQAAGNTLRRHGITLQ